MELTESAIKRVTELLNDDGEAIALRIGLIPSGCSGYQYSYALEYEMKGYDNILVSYKSAAIITDMATHKLLEGATLDYVKNLAGSEFKITNPNIGNTCGCGVSFQIDNIKIDPK